MLRLPKYVLVAGGPTLLISCDPGFPTVPRGTYMPFELENGNVRLEGVSHDVRGKTFTVTAAVWPGAVADYRIGEA